jgi:type II secretion system protein J
MPKRKSRGLTLIEVLVAVAILGMVVAAIYSTWTSILRATRVGLDAAAAAQRERMTMRLFEEALASVRMFAANWPWYAFLAQNGEEASLSFVSHLPRSFPRSGKFGDHAVRRVAFSLERGSEGDKELVLRQSPLLMDVDKDEQEHPLVLARNVKELRFEFWDAQLNDWTEEWLQTNQIPRIVKISLLLGNSSVYSIGAQPREQTTRVIMVHAVGVSAVWQTAGMPAGRLGGTNLPPGQMPNVPGMNLPPGVPPSPTPGRQPMNAVPFNPRGDR